MKNQDDKIKQSMGHVMGNIVWILKFVFKYAPMLVWDKAIRIPIAVATAYIEINLTRWILDSVGQGTFSAAVKAIITIFSFIIIANCVQAVLAILVVPQKQINLRASMRKELIEKVSRIDQLNFQDSQFFDNYTLALNEVDTRAVSVLECVAAVVTSLASFYVVTDTTHNINRKFAWFGITAAWIDMALGVLRQNMNYKKTLETTPDDRKRAYVGRVTYQPEFTSDLKIYPEFKKLLIFRYGQATAGVKRIIHKYAKKIIWIDQGQQIPSMVFRRILPWTFVALLLSRQEVTIPEATVLASAAITIPNTLSKFISEFQKFYSHSLYIEKLRQLFALEERIERADKSCLELRQPVDMVLDGVSFAYAQGMPAVLKQVSLGIRHGEKIAVVGFNGAGKTTLAKLMIRLFDSSEGRLLINEQPVEKYSAESVRSNIIYLSQDFKIYGFTVAENILMHPVSGEEDVRLVNSALQLVGLYEKVSGFQNGINTFVTREFDNEGVYFSGGEMQKLVLARVYAGNYDFIILDEATSALDPVSEDEILKMIFDIFRDKTIVMIAHRLAAVQYVNHVYFMEKGEIREEGTHKQLMELQGQYAKFYMTQAEKYGSI